MPEPTETPVPPGPSAPAAKGPDRRRAHVVGTGLIGGSIGSGLRRRGWYVTGEDLVGARARRAVEVGAIDAVSGPVGASVCFVATPAGATAEAVEAVLAASPGTVVTDVAGVKSPVVGKVTDPRFVGGHPMAGSEQEGVDGSDPDMFEGATWVLTPESHTDPDAFAAVRSAVSQLGANVVELPANRHDDLVAMVSHVPHLTAATLMNLATDAATEHAALLRLAAGGFRDMTRIAAGEPSIWPDVCGENRDSILDVLDRLISSLGEVRTMVAADDREQLLGRLERARQARVNLPAGVPASAEVLEVRIPVADRPGSIAAVTTLLGEMGVNIWDLEIAHSAEGDRGVMVLVVDAAAAEAVRAALHERSYRCSFRPVGP